jgi:hypothetical protein
MRPRSTASTSVRVPFRTAPLRAAPLRSRYIGCIASRFRPAFASAQRRCRRMRSTSLRTSRTSLPAFLEPGCTSPAGTAAQRPVRGRQLRRYVHGCAIVQAVPHGRGRRRRVCAVVHDRVLSAPLRLHCSALRPMRSRPPRSRNRWRWWQVVARFSATRNQSHRAQQSKPFLQARRDGGGREWVGVGVGGLTHTRAWGCRRPCALRHLWC